LQLASAGPITGSFNMSGTVTVTASTIDWNSDVSPFTSQMFSLSSGAGSFSGVNGQNTIENLSIVSEPVGTSFPGVTFISFGASGLPALLLTEIYSGTGGTAGCSAAPAINETCTIANPPFGSPFTFTDDPPPSALQSDAKFVFSGVTADGTADWTAIFTSQFSQSYQTVLAAFAPGGSGTVTNSYSGTVTFTPVPSSVPEPGTIMLTGLGFVGLALALRKFGRAKV
jgi:hypothetical protein